MATPQKMAENEGDKNGSESIAKTCRRCGDEYTGDSCLRVHRMMFRCVNSNCTFTTFDRSKLDTHQSQCQTETEATGSKSEAGQHHTSRHHLSVDAGTGGKKPKTDWNDSENDSVEDEDLSGTSDNDNDSESGSSLDSGSEDEDAGVDSDNSNANDKKEAGDTDISSADDNHSGDTGDTDESQGEDV